MTLAGRMRRAFTPIPPKNTQQRRRGRRGPTALLAGLAFLAYYVLVLHEQVTMQANSPEVEGHLASNSRQILSSGFSLSNEVVGLFGYKDDENCTNPVDWAFVVPVYICGCIYLFLGLAVICDDYFVASLENISETLRLSEDVAGATFMAAGSSAPELFTSMLGTLVFESDVGIGTIVGSAVFNILVIVGITILLSGNKLVLDWRPLTRDCAYYGFSIILLIAAFVDGGIQWYEAVIFVLAYIGYILIMVVNRTLMGTMTDCQMAVYTMFLGRKVEDSDADDYQGDPEDLTDAKPLTADVFGGEEVADVDLDDDVKKPAVNPFAKMMAKNKAQVVPEEEPSQEPARFDAMLQPMNTGNEISAFPVHGAGNPNAYPANHAMMVRDAALMAPKSTDPRVRFRAAVFAVIAANRFGKFVNRDTVIMEVEDEVEESPIEEELPEIYIPPAKKKTRNPLKLILNGIYLFFALPYKVLFILTVPNCGLGGCWYWWFPFTFSHSIIWIGLLSFFMVDLAERAGCVIQIPSVVMGLTFIAAGTSVPDALSSVAVAKSGLGDMAVANAIGSNVFDICFGLGLPWAIKAIAVNAGGEVEISGSTWETVMFASILFLTLFGFYGVIALGRFKLTPKIGYIFLGTYVVFMIWAIVWAYAIRDLVV